MKPVMLAVCGVCALGVAVSSAAQSDKMDKGKMGKEMMVTGCVAQGSDMSHFMLTNAMMSGGMKGEMSTTGGDMKAMTYNLMGGDLKAHVGHKVEVTGMMADDKMMANGKMDKDKMDKDKMDKDKDKMGKSDMHALNVKSVKMIASTCP